MGLCQGFCSPKDTVSQAHPDMEKLKSRFGDDILTPGCFEDGDEASLSYDGLQLQAKTFSQKERTILVDDFRKAIKEGNFTMVMFLHDEHPTLCNFETVKIEDGYLKQSSCLEVAVRYKRHAVIEYILKCGVSPNGQNIEGNTVLHIATRAQDIRSVTILCEYDADPNIRNHDDESPLTIADELHDCKLIEALGGHPDIDPNEIDNQQEVEDESNENHYVTTLKTFKPKKRRETGMRRTTVKLNNTVHDILADTDCEEPSNVATLQVVNTNKLNEIADDIYDDITENIAENKKNLAALQGWLLRKQHSPPYSWLKRYVLIRDGYFLWSDRMLTVGDDGLTRQEKKRWSHYVKLVNIDEIEPILEGKTQRKFRMKLKGNKTFVWKTENKQERDKWVQEIQHRQRIRNQEKALVSST